VTDRQHIFSTEKNSFPLIFNNNNNNNNNNFIIKFITIIYMKNNSMINCDDGECDGGFRGICAQVAISGKKLKTTADFTTERQRGRHMGLK
jgi:hypothetical protein